MGRQKAGNKAYRALDLLTGLYDPEIMSILARYGLDELEVERGWELLRAYGRTRRAAPPASELDDKVRDLDVWENRWFVVCDAALAHSFPKVHAWLFRDLGRASGDRVVFSVSGLLTRLRKLEDGVDALGQDGPAALARLRQRGLTPEVMAEADELLQRFPQVEPAPPGMLRSPVAEAAAEQALWEWYLEWSGIARAVLQEKRLLNHIGFGKVGRPRKRS